jgi:hypothetical protein
VDSLRRLNLIEPFISEACQSVDAPGERHAEVAHLSEQVLHILLVCFQRFVHGVHIRSQLLHLVIDLLLSCRDGAAGSEHPLLVGPTLTCVTCDLVANSVKDGQVRLHRKLALRWLIRDLL